MRWDVDRCEQQLSPTLAMGSSLASNGWSFLAATVNPGGHRQ